MTEYFIHAESRPAPLVPDDWTEYVEAETPEKALLAVAARCRHCAGLDTAAAYPSADAFHKEQPPLAQWKARRDCKRTERTTP